MPHLFRHANADFAGGLVLANLVDTLTLPDNGHANLSKGQLNKLADRAGLVGGNDIVIWGVLLQHEPHHLDIVAGVAPVALRVQVAQHNVLLQAQADLGHGARDLASDKRLTTARALVVEEDAVAAVHTVCLAVIDHNPVPVHLGDAIGRAVRGVV